MERAQVSRFELTRYSLIKTSLRSRWPQLVLRAFTLGIFILAILAGIVGTPVGNRNIAIVLVWIAWWGLLALLAVPLFGRGWCSICPIPMPGEWLQQGSLLKPSGKGYGLQRRWPNLLRNIWVQNGAFLLLALFSAVILTVPKVSALVLAAFLLVAIVASLIFERRAFCRYLCPVGGFIGLYSQSAALELRVIDASVCAAHTEKTCYTGSDDGYGCPWLVFPGGLTNNTFCGLCTECLRTCTRDNIAIFVRQPGADLLKTKLFALCDRGIDLPDCIALAPTAHELDECVPWLAVQDGNSQLWWQVPDLGGRDGNYLEASGSAMIAYAWAKGARLGMLEPRYRELAKESFDGLVRELVDWDPARGGMTLRNVCRSAGLGGDPYRDGSYEYYVSTDVVSNDAHGVGAFLLASAEIE